MEKNAKNKYACLFCLGISDMVKKIYNIDTRLTSFCSVGLSLTMLAIVKVGLFSDIFCKLSRSGKQQLIHLGGWSQNNLQNNRVNLKM
jgi:hypothetical protein